MTQSRSPIAAAAIHLAAALILVVPFVIVQLVAFKLITWELFVGELCTGVTAFVFIGAVMRRLAEQASAGAKTLSDSMRTARFVLLRFLLIPIGTFGFHFVTRLVFANGVIEALMSFLAAALVFGWVDRVLDQRRRFGPSDEKGTKLIAAKEAVRRAEEIAAANGGPKVRWGPLVLAEELSETHFCVVGTPGSGKTLLLRHLMQSIMPQIGRLPDRRAVVYDPQRSFVPLLSGMGLAAPLIIMNPFDARAVAWDMAADVTTPTTALQVASILIPETADEGANKHFSETARALLAGIFSALHLVCPGRWTFRDVLLIGSDPKRLATLLSGTQHTKRLVEAHLRSDRRTTQNYLSTLSTALDLFHPIAAMWAHATSRLSLRDWVNGSSILVLGNDAAARKEIDAINRVIFQRLSELLLQQSDSGTRRTWIVLDEAREAGDLRGLNSLLVAGRSKGVRGALGFQDIDGLRSVYGKERASELVGVCGTKALLRLDSDVTAQWASDVIGSWRGTLTGRTFTKDEVSVTERIEKQEAVLPSEFLNLPPVDKARGVFEGFYISPLVGKFHAPFSFLSGLAEPGDEPAFEARPDEHQYILPFAPEDFERLHFTDDAANGQASGSDPMSERGKGGGIVEMPPQGG